ncbi:hypothetical protein FQN54_003705 [Arachnomyces sp. PD_36]|nr:hypothetical protein FQN54_003705 [Arachnomyces sp. PD_36]
MSGSSSLSSAPNDTSQTDDPELDLAQIKYLTLEARAPKERTIDYQIRVWKPKEKRKKKAKRRKSLKYNLGILERLPLEVIQMVILQLDLLSLTRFRLVNRLAKKVTGLIPEYQRIIEHAREAFLSILAVEMGHLITCQTLYDKIREKIDSLPCVRTIPGQYLPLRFSSSRRPMVDEEAALNAGIELHGSRNGIVKYVTSEIARKRREYRESFEKAQAEGRNPILRRPYIPRKPADDKSWNRARFMGVVRMPWYNEATRKPEWGLYCLACKQPPVGQASYKRRLTVEGFREHVKEFGRIVDYKHRLTAQSLPSTADENSGLQ